MTGDVVAVGASLGGLDASRVLLAGLPLSFPCPLVLVQHRRAECDGRLVEILSRHSCLPVLEPFDKDPILPGYVYVAPSNYHLSVERGYFSLSLADPVAFARPSIDVLFESLADSYGSKAIAVMLTSSSRDGARGARAIKQAGGVLIVEDPATAEAPLGPRAVLEESEADAVLPLGEIAAYLIQRLDDSRGR